MAMLNGVVPWHLVLLLSVAVLLVGLAHCPHWHRRRVAIRRITARPRTHLCEEWTRLAEDHRIPLVDVDRIWRTLCCHYSIPADIVRSKDGLLAVLSGITSHPDYDVCSRRLFLRDRCAAQEALAGVATWEDLVVAVFILEQRHGMKIG